MSSQTRKDEKIHNIMYTNYTECIDDFIDLEKQKEAFNSNTDGYEMDVNLECSEKHLVIKVQIWKK